MIKIVTDSTSYLPPRLVAEHDIQIVPIYLSFDKQAYREGTDIDIEAFWQKLARFGLPTTSQPSPEEFISVCRPLLEAGHEVIALLISSRLSSTLAAAQAAARTLGGEAICVVDSASMAMGLGLQVLRAAELARAGLGREEIVSAIERMQEAIHVVFTLDTLEHLRRGGRINTAKAWLGALLHVRPLLSLQEGVLKPLEQVRTTKRAYARQLELTLDFLGDDPSPWISVMHSRSLDVARELSSVLKARFPGGRFFCSEIGPALAAHLGTGVGIIACPSTVL